MKKLSGLVLQTYLFEQDSGGVGGGGRVGEKDVAFTIHAQPA